MGRLVPQVFLKPRARVSVDDPLVALCQEERSPRRQLGIIELEKVNERISIVEHVDLDRILVGSAAENRGALPGRARAPAGTGPPVDLL